MTIEEQDIYDCALLLLFSASRMILNRKVYEAMHGGLSTGYEEDPFVIVKIQEFLADKIILERLEKILKN